MEKYHMPALTEQERDVQISNCKALIEQITKDCSVGWNADRAYLLPLKIALAALTAEPVAYGYVDDLFGTGGKISAYRGSSYSRNLYETQPVATSPGREEGSD